MSQPRASCCALYLRGNVPPSLFPFKKKNYNELEVATGTIRRAWARPSFCENPINKRVRVAGELTFKVHGFGVEIQSVNGPIIEVGPVLGHNLRQHLEYNMHLSLHEAELGKLLRQP